MENKSLYFHSSRGDKRLVKAGVPADQVGKEITAVVKELNPDYKIYYMRSWEKDGITYYDIGSHTEFFTWE